MSFYGIRKIRDFKRDSPNIYIMEYGSPGLSFSSTVAESQSKTKNGRDSPKKCLLKRNDSRSPSKQKSQKFPMMGNFLHINLQGIKPLTKNIKKDIFSSKTDRPGFSKRLTEILPYSQKFKEYQKNISLTSFSRDFVVGKGGFGKVWKVYEKKTNKVYAMKQMLKVKIISKKSVHSVVNEKFLLSKLRHPFLVNMIHSFQNKECLFLIMDYCNRGDLRYHLGNRQKFSQEQSRFFISCIILCLEYLHSHRIIHRDLKPENLVFDEKGYLRVTDLGVSKEVKLNNAEDTSGTPGYMSPQVICKMNHSYPVDFFALGVIAYELMVGKRPYLGQNRKQIRQKILAKQVQLDQIPPYGWSRQSISFINKLIQRKPENRLGHNDINEVKNHPWLRKVEWSLLKQQKIKPPFLPPTIEQDYHNYQECISEDTQILDIEEYNLLLRHPDTQKAFEGYEHNIDSPRRKVEKESTGFTSLMYASDKITRRSIK